MKSNRLFVLTFAFASAVSLPAFAQAQNGGHEHKHHADAPAAEEAPKPEWLAAAKASYPLDTCVVSGDKLGSEDMGEPFAYVHKESGKPDRLVLLCCKGCVKTFKKDPAKYLQKLDEAAAAKNEHKH